MLLLGICKGKFPHPKEMGQMKDMEMTLKPIALRFWIGCCIKPMNVFFHKAIKKNSLQAYYDLPRSDDLARVSTEW